MSEHRLYGELAELWPLVSPPADYAEEGRILAAVLRDLAGPVERPSLLDLGSGGGHHLHAFAPDFEAVAVDRSEAMLTHSRRLNPGVEHAVGDLRTLRLGRSFDLCLIHDALAYLVDADDVAAALATASTHLAPGGGLVLVPDRLRETFVDGALTHSSHSDGERELTFVEYVHDPDPSDTHAELVLLLLLREGGRVRVEEDRHTVGLFSRAQWLSMLAEAGFEATLRPFVEDHRLIAARNRPGLE